MPEPLTAEQRAANRARSRIRYWRRQRQMPIDVLAEAAGVTERTLRRWEEGHEKARNPDLRTVIRVAAVLHTTLEAIIEPWWEDAASEVRQPDPDWQYRVHRVDVVAAFSPDKTWPPPDMATGRRVE